MTQRNARPTPAAPGRPRSHPACSQKPDEGGDKEEVKLEGPVSARHCSCAELLLKLTSQIPLGTLMHGTDLHSGPKS